MFLDCTTCLDCNAAELRADMGCGFLVPDPERPAGSVWRHRGELDADRTTCPGYTARLPDVIDAASCFVWFEKSQLALRLDGDPPPALLSAVEILHTAVEHFRSWRMDPKRGGAS